MSAQKTILVAEDDLNDTYLLKRAFLKAGIDVQMDFVEDGAQAIRYLADRNRRSHETIPELLLLDLNMPRVNGFEVLKWVRHQPGLKRMLVIVLTSSEEPGDINRAYDLGANSYLVKPCRIEHLAGIAEHLHHYWININRQPDCTEQAA